MPLTIYLILRSAVRRVSKDAGSVMQAASARRPFERQEGAEHDLLAVEIEAVRPGEEARDVFPHLHPLIKAAAGGEPAHALALTLDDLARSVIVGARLPVFGGRRADHPREPLGQQLRHRAVTVLG